MDGKQKGDKMKRWIHASEDVFAMSNLNPRRTNLPVIIWADHSGVGRKVSHRNDPRVKISKDKYEISISIEEHPQIKAQSHSRIPKVVMDDLQEGIDYVARNWDIFLQHYQDTDFSFDDDDLKDELRARGEYK